MVPRLTTALTGPLLDLERRILERMPDIERWLRTQWQEHAVPFYASVDLRNAGFKLAPIDTNLFPGGFNNLNPAFVPLCVQAIQAAVERVCPDARGVLLIPENHTRNTFYLQNVAALTAILRRAGMHVRIGSLLPEITAATKIDLPGGAPDVLRDIDQPIAPPLTAGWYNRRKSHHFEKYQQVAKAFAELIGIDRWLIDPFFGVCGELDFRERAGEEC